MADFDWLTEDDGEWSVEAGERREQRKRPSWRYPVLILIVLIMTTGSLYAFFNRRAEATQDAIEAEVRRTHQLVMEAADNGDVELFTTLISGASTRWLEMQLESVRRGRFDETHWMGFRLDERPYRLDGITIAPTLDEAVVTYTRWYEDLEQSGQVYALQQVAVYRRGEDRWLLAPPTADFWGDDVTIREGPLTIVYPERDEGIVQRLAEDLIASLPEICDGLVTGHCPQGWNVELELSPELENEVFPSQIEGSYDDLSLRLPLPTLVGLPVDEVAYLAVFQNYRRLLHRRVTVSLSRYVAESPELLPPVLEGDTVATLPEREMTFACASGTVGRLNWNIFRYSLGNGNWNVVFQRDYSVEDSGFVTPLSEGNSYVIQEYLQDELLTARLLIWQAGETTLVAEQTVNFDNALVAPFLEKLDPTGRYMVVGMSKEAEISWSLLNWERCIAGEGCELLPVLNSPIWSPDGEQMLLEEPLLNRPAYRLLYRADEAGQNPIEIGEGGTPFWLDETTYGYSRLNDEGEVDLVLADISDDEAKVWVETADLMTLAPTNRNWDQMRIWYIWVNPANPEMALLMTNPDNTQFSGPIDFFLVNGTGDAPQIEWLFDNEYPASTGTNPFSPDGRYLFVSQRGTPIHFRDLETGETVPYDDSFGFFTGWTPDGRYYIQRADDALTFTMPFMEDQFQIIYNFSTCSGVHWLEPQKN